MMTDLSQHVAPKLKKPQIVYLGSEGKGQPCFTQAVTNGLQLGRHSIWVERRIHNVHGRFPS